MKLLLVLVSIYLNLFQIINTKPYRILMEDKLLPYIDRSVSPHTDYFLFDNFILEQIDDENVQIGGYITALKSMDRNLPLLINIRTQNYEKATWNEAVYQITLPSACPEFINPHRMWYNVTKLWTSDLCPTQKGDKWYIETNQLKIIYDMPPTMPIVPWRAYILVSQGIPKFEKIKFGFGLELNLLPIN